MSNPLLISLYYSTTILRTCIAMREFYFERMRVWQEAHRLTNEIYRITNGFPKEEDYHLKSQMRRAASSIKSNIAEGQGRKTKKDQAHYTNLSFSSLIELLNHLLTARDQKYIPIDDYYELRASIEKIGNQLNALRTAQESKIRSNG